MAEYCAIRSARDNGKPFVGGLDSSALGADPVELLADAMPVVFFRAFHEAMGTLACNSQPACDVTPVSVRIRVLGVPLGSEEEEEEEKDLQKIGSTCCDEVG